MSVYERLSKYDSKKGPPESTCNRQMLQYGRYDYYTEPESDASANQKSRSAAEVDAIVDRLRQELPRPPPASVLKESKKVTPEEADAIFERLQRCDFTRQPVESSTNKQHLGKNRYDFYHGPAHHGKGKQASQEEIDGIVARLSAYDVNKTPPNSRALEIKQAKAAQQH